MLALCANSVSAATMDFDVLSFEHSLKPTDTALDTGISLDLGEAFSVSADVADFWSLGNTLFRSINADGDSEATGAPAFGTYTDSASGQTFVFGQLVGRIGTGDYFLLGTNFSGSANGAGNLFLLNWDSDNAGNSGSINATVTFDGQAAVPLPAALPLLLVALGGLGLTASRRRVS